MSNFISISLSPNVFSVDLAAARHMLRRPRAWQEGEHLASLAGVFSRYHGVSEQQVFSFNSGRSALLISLASLGIGAGDEVLLQAFTCNAVPNPVLWAGAMPIYVDVKEDTFTMDAADLEKKITPRAKAIIVQHTFGLATDMESVLSVAKRHRIFVIEDCAHALGATYSCNTQHVTCSASGKKAGTMGDMAFFSFGRDKVISSVYGGMLLVNNGSLLKGVKEGYEALQYPSNQWIRQQLRHPLAMDMFLRWYNVPFPNYGAGKFFLQAVQVTRYLSKAVHWKEKQGLRPSYFPYRLPNALAYLALTQFKRLDDFNAHRRTLAKLYYDEMYSLKTKYERSESAAKAGYLKLKTPQDGHIYLRYPIRHPRAHEIIARARAQGILLGDWYTSVIAPDDTRLEAMRYKNGSCPTAERLAQETFNLPTNPNITERDARRVVEFLKTVLERKV